MSLNTSSNYIKKLFTFLVIYKSKGRNKRVKISKNSDVFQKENT